MWVCVIQSAVIMQGTLVFAQTAEEYYKQGLELKRQNRMQEAITAFNRAIEKNWKYADAYYELGMLYLQKGDAFALKKAEGLLKEAQFYGKDKMRYRASLARICESQGKYSTAYSEWEKVLAIEPGNIQALEGMARYHFRNADDYRYRINPQSYFSVIDKNIGTYIVRYQPSGIPEQYYSEKYIETIKQNEMMPALQWNKFVAKEDSLAEVYCKKVLLIDPEDRDALYLLVSLYNKKVTFQETRLSGSVVSGYGRDTAASASFVRYANSLAQLSPNDKTALLLLGIAYNWNGDYEEAQNAFSGAGERMTADERVPYSDVSYLRAGGIRGSDNLLPAAERSSFWRRHDPVFLTPYNERELEHFCRIAEANILFSVPIKKIEGWKTDRGKIYIRYGPPRLQIRYEGQTDRAINQIFLYEIWYYENFTFIFQQLFQNPNADFVLADWYGLNFIQIAKDVEVQYPEYYEYNPGLQFPYDCASFRGDRGLTRVELYYGIPAKTIQLTENENALSGSVTTGFYLADKNWDVVFQDVEDIGVQYSDSVVRRRGDVFTVEQSTYLIVPGFYHISIEMRDDNGSHTGAYRDTLRVDTYGTERIQISDIKLARDISIIEPDKPISRENIDITPSPFRYFQLNEPIYI